MVSFTLGQTLKASLLPRRPPSMSQWAKSKIVVPDGPYKGERFSCDIQPFSRLFFQEVDSGRWDRIVATGPTQTGKSLIAYVIPVCFHLFALGETVVAGLPTLDLAEDKWAEDFRPVIEASPELRKLQPATGPGSRSGRVQARVKFRNGATLRFLSGGGGDKSRAGFTGRVLAVTEVDGLNEAGRTSKEADKLKQMEARQRAFLAAGIRTYLECTVTSASGRIWTEYTGGTESRLAIPCPRCGQYVTPEREHLKGWQEAESELQARSNAAWTCPACSDSWTEAERHQANLAGVLVHRGQTVTAGGRVAGPIPATRTLGFRWTAVNNHFATAADVAADEWNALQERDRENAEKELRQFVHCIPYDPPEVDLQPLDPDAVQKRTAALKKGIIPKGCVGVTVGIDTGKRLLHWTAVAWAPDGRGHIIEYGNQTVASDKLGTQKGLVVALRTLKTYFDGGWQSQDGENWTPAQTWIDAGYYEHTHAVYEFCREANKGLSLGAARYRPSKGYATGQRRLEQYREPKQKNAEIRYIGRSYYLTKTRRAGTMLAHINSDFWKAQLHQRLNLPPDSPEAVVLYEAADPTEHTDFAEQVTAERQIEKWIEGRGEVVAWERIRRKNHYLDSSYAALAAGDLIQTVGQKAQNPAAGRRTLAERAGMHGQPEQVGWFAAQQRRR